MKKLLLLIVLLPSLQIFAGADDSKILNLEPLNALKNIIKSDYDPKISDLRGLINALNAYASGTLGGVRLAPPLSDIYNAVNDVYKNFYLADEEFSKKAVSITKGNITTEVVKEDERHNLADVFLQTLIYSIVTGKLDKYFFPIIKTLAPTVENTIRDTIKEEKIGY